MAQIVPEHSSVLDLPNEQVVPLNADHRGICRYASRNGDYLLVEAAIKELAQTTHDVASERLSHTLMLPSATQLTCLLCVRSA